MIMAEWILRNRFEEEEKQRTHKNVCPWQQKKKLPEQDKSLGGKGQQKKYNTWHPFRGSKRCIHFLFAEMEEQLAVALGGAADRGLGKVATALDAVERICGERRERVYGGKGEVLFNANKK